MSKDNESWCRVSRAELNIDNKIVKYSSEEWSMEKLTPKEFKRTRTIKFSYTGMIIIHRNVKK